MKLKELIESISKDIEITKSFSETVFGMNIDYVSFKFGSHYYLVSHGSKGCVYILTEQTQDGSKDISSPNIFEEIGLKEYIKRLVILEN